MCIRDSNEEEPFLFEQTLQRLTFKREQEFVQLIEAIAIHYSECVELDYRNFADAFLAPE